MTCDPDLFVGWHELHPDRHLNFQLNRWAGFGGPRWLEDVRPFLDQFKNYDAWCSIFALLGERADADGRAFHAALHFRAAEFFMPPGDPRKMPLRRRLLPMLRAANGVHESARREVLYQNARLPVWDFFPAFTQLGRQGWHVVAFDGPGQGTVLHDQQVPFTPHWHGPVGAVLDALNLNDVTVVGISLGGCLALRAAAFEPRIRRVVAFDVLADLHRVTLYQQPKAIAAGLEVLLALGARSIINRGAKSVARNNLQQQWMQTQGMLAFGAPTTARAIEAARAYHTRDISHLVTQDVLLMAGEDDHFIPIDQLGMQDRLLTSTRSTTLRVFTRAEQAQAHCQVGNLPLAVRVMSDWARSKQEG
jgi:pimeloyl-ACP methyl ester carboxylesterase